MLRQGLLVESWRGTISQVTPQEAGAQVLGSEPLKRFLCSHRRQKMQGQTLQGV